MSPQLRLGTLQGREQAAEVRRRPSGEVLGAHSRQHHRQHVHFCAQGDAVPAVRGVGRHRELRQRQRRRPTPHVSVVSFTHTLLGRVLCSEIEDSLQYCS